MATNFTSYLRLAVDSRDVANADRDLRGMAGSADVASRATNALGSVAKTAFGLIAAGIGGAKIIDYSNQWTDLNSRVLNATKSQSLAAEVMDSINVTARNTYSSLQQTAEAYLQNSTTLTDLNFSTKQQIELSEALNNGLVISGTKGIQAASTMNALSKAFAEGALRGDNFNTVIASGGRLVESIAKEFGVTTVELRALASEGLLTTSRLVNAFTNDLDNLRSEAEKMPATVGDAVLQVDNAFLRLVGTINELSGASDTITNPILAIVDAMNSFSEGLTASQVAYYIDAITVSATALAVALGAKLAYSYATTTAASIKAAATARLETAAYAEAAVATARADAARSASAVSRVAGEQALNASRIQSLQAVAAQISSEQSLENVRYRAQITDAGRAASIARMAAIGRDRANVANQIAAAEARQLTIAANLTAAQNAQTLSTQRLSAANTALAASTGALSFATRAATSVIMAMGGPLGAILIAASAFAIFATRVDESDYAIKNISGTLDQAIAKFEQMTEAQRAWAELSLSNQIEKDRAKIEELEKSLGKFVTTTDGLGRKTTTWYEALTGDKAVEAKAQIDELNDSISESEKRLAAFAEIAPAWMVNLGRAIDNFTSKNEEANEELVSLFDNFDLITKVGGQLESLFRTDLFSFGDAKADAEDLFNSFDKMEKVGRQLDSLFGSDLFSFDGEKEATEVQKIIAALEQEVIALEAGEVAYLAYQLAMQGASEEEIRAAVSAKQRAIEIRKVAKDTVSASDEIGRSASSFGDVFDQVFANIVDGSGNVYDVVVDGFKAMIATMVKETVLNPIILNVQKSMTGKPGEGESGVGGIGSAIGAMGMGGIYAAAAVVAVSAINSWNKDQDKKFAEMTAEFRQGNQSTGTLLGLANEKSDSIANVLGDMDSKYSDVLSVNYGMYQALVDIRAGIAGVASGFARTMNFDQSISGLGTSLGPGFRKELDTAVAKSTVAVFDPGAGVGKLIGGEFAKLFDFQAEFLGGVFIKVSKNIHSESKKIIDSGIQIVGTSLADILATGSIEAFSYADIQSQKKTFGIKHSTKVGTSTEEMGDLFQSQLASVMSNAADALKISSSAYGLDFDSLLNQLVIDPMKLSLKDLEGDAIAKEIEHFLSATMDGWADVLLAGTDVLDRYQQVGEGAFETMVRISTQTEQFTQQLGFVGLELGLTGVAAVKAVQDIAGLVGGFDALSGSMSVYYDKFFTDAEKFENLADQLAGATGGILDSLPKTHSEFRAIIEALDLTTESGSKAFAELITLSGAIDQYIVSLEKQTSATVSAANQMLSALQNAINSQKTGLQGILDNASGAKSALDDAIAAERARLTAISQTAIEALNAQKSSLSGISSAQTAGLNAQKSFVQQSINNMTGLSKRLRDAVASMTESTPERSLTQFYDAAAQISAAISGDFKGSLDSAIGILSGVDRSIFGSQFEAESEIARSQLRMLELAETTDQQITIEEKMLSSIEAQIANAERYAAYASAGVDRQISQAQASLAEEMAALDELASAAQSQLNALLGVEDGVLSLEEALAKFEEARENAEGVQSQIQLLDELLNTAQSEYNLLADVSGGINDLNLSIENFALAIRDANIAQGKQQSEENAALITEIQSLRRQQEAAAISNAELQRVIANYTRTTAQELENQRRSQNA